MKTKDYQHIFAIFLDEEILPEYLFDGAVFVLKKKEILTRIIKILRLRPLDEIMFFDNFVACKFQIIEYDQNKFIKFLFVELLSIKSPSVEVHLFLPILKKPAFEEALYLATAVGLSSITPVVYKKSDSSWNFEKELSRFKKIITSAQEQAKSFRPVVFNKKLKLEQIDLAKLENPVFCDPKGISFIECKYLNKNNFSLFVGPEGGFVKEEKNKFESANFIKLSLINNILKSEHAVLLAAGLLLN